MVECKSNFGKQKICPNFNFSLSFNNQSGKKIVGVESFNTSCVSCDGSSSNYNLVCEEPTMDILKACEVGSQFLNTEGLLGLGRVLVEKESNISTSGGSDA